MSRQLYVAWCGLLLSPIGCGPTGGASDGAAGPPDLTAPPLTCKMPGTVVPLFADITTAVLPHAGSPSTAPTSNTLHAGDLDGDGYPDLITTGGDPGYPKPCTDTDPCNPRDTATHRTRFVYMNRPDPADPSGKKRIFVDATDETHLMDTADGQGGFSFGTANIGDVDNDGDNDVVVGPGDANTDSGAVMLNDGSGHFKLAPSGDVESLLVGITPATATLFDFDADGVLDYLPGTFAYPPPNFNPPMLFKGMGDGVFANVVDQLGIVTECSAPQHAAPTCSPMYGLTTCDLDMDGDQDILFASYGREPNQIWRNDGDHFTEIGVQVGLAYDDRMDFSDDQSYRCYCMNRPGKCMPEPPMPYSPCYCNGFGLNPCVVKMGETSGICKSGGARCTTETEACDCLTPTTDGRGWSPGYSDQPWSLGGNNYSLVCADVDNDGDMDIMTGTIRHWDVGSATDPSELCLNDTPPGMPLGKFRRPGSKATGIDRSAFEAGMGWNEGDLTVQMADVDNDGLKDIYICSSDYPGDHGWLFHQKADHTFEDVTTKAKVGQNEPHGIAFFDFDKDGDLDLALGTSTFRGGAPHSTLKIYENKTGQDNNWVQLQLVGKGKGGTNRSAIGALVKVTAGGVTQMQEISGGHSASATENELILTFGLGATCAIDKVEVRWLDGKKTLSTFTEVRANYRIRITEGQDAVEYLQ